MRAAPFVLLALAASAHAATPEAEDRDWLRLDLALEYRAQYNAIKALSVNDLSAERVAYFDQRGRLDGRFFIGEQVNVRLMLDVLDGVLFGDNGSFVSSPFRNRGAVIAAKSPNLARITVDQLDPAGSTVDLGNFGLKLAAADPVTVRMLYGEALLPVGLLRAGRQPLVNGRNVLVHEGSRINRWGTSHQPDVVDGIAFGTKLSAIFDLVLGREVDKSAERGLFIGSLVGQIVENIPTNGDDDNQQVATTLFYKGTDLYLLGFEIPRLDAGVVHTHRWNSAFEGILNSITAYFLLDVGKLSLSAYHVSMFGGTREISEALALLGSSSGPPTRQDIDAFGGFVEVAYRVWKLELIFELFYATGDDTPKSDEPINQLTFAEDTNVGLHLFENVIGYATARSAARGVANLRALGTQSFPVAEINTRGSFQNGIALFPQIVARPWEWISVRGGVLFAFTERANVDPVATILGGQGVDIQDDLVNFNGGKPGSYWGTEIDLGLTLYPVPGLMIDLEGAYLIPGDALHDENGDAVPSALGNVRLTYFFDGPGLLE